MTNTDTTNSIPLDDKVILIDWSNADVVAIADELGIDPEVAVERAERWANAIMNTACDLIGEQLASVIEHDTP